MQFVHATFRMLMILGVLSLGINALIAAQSIPSISTGLLEGRPCQLQTDGSCMCNSTYCDAVAPAGLASLRPSEYVIYSSSSAGARLQRSQGTLSSSVSSISNSSSGIRIDVDLNTRYQSILGFGGAFTDASAYVHQTLPTQLQEFFMESYFSASGIEYSIGRIPIASSDFSLRPYSYCDKEDDFAMATFNISMDLPVKVPFIRRALAAATGPVKLFGSNWSPPYWMKSNKNRIGGHMLGTPGDKYHKALAQYLVRFVEEYRRVNLTMWGLTAQNEPGTWDSHGWDGCGFTPEKMRDFTKLDLGPLLATRAPEVALMTCDNQKGDVEEWAKTVLDDPEARKYVKGLAFHWYDTVYNLFPKFDVVKRAADAHKDVFFLASEACTGSNFVDAGPRVGDWRRGEIYSFDILGDLLAGAGGWVDWNLILDIKGGPNHAKNVVDAPIITDGELPPEGSGGQARPSSRFFKNPMFYHLGHFSKFVRPGSLRVEATFAPVQAFQAGAFLVPATTREPANVAVVLLNPGDVDQQTAVHFPGKGVASVLVPAHSIHTLLVRV